MGAKHVETTKCVVYVSEPAVVVAVVVVAVVAVFNAVVSGAFNGIQYAATRSSCVLTIP